ncbi:MAG TPA: hydrogenase formation protein HypD [Bacteroidia bacterium]|nr:hydrogenase formation protein HypD [Bacteroidia bacterium]HRS59747.1 hydrogenase formation protein HypD [Bacteroidia bacterium]HRU69213.1 hydrogenase formation protein HypD [Bacteroidia bacterium]
MKFIDEYRDKKLIDRLVTEINTISTKQIRLMEVCGGHTMAIQRFGIPSLLPHNVRLISGPGCPVCVTSRKYIDHLIALCRIDEVILTTYGDLIRVPGSSSTLELERSRGKDVRIVYSILDALQLARENPQKKVIFAGIGFETTTPPTAAGVLTAKNENLRNFFVLSAHKVMPPAMEALIDEGIQIDGYIAPGHVSTITGSGIYEPLTRKFGVGCVISGFEPADLLESILMLVRQIEYQQPAVEIQYKRAVRPEGNLVAKAMIEKVFEPCDDWWRGLGILPASGLKLKDEYADFDADKIFNIEIEPTRDDKGCICGEVLKGIKSPKECKLFGKACTPSDPAGACMVSSEGACHAYYRYNRL